MTDVEYWDRIYKARDWKDKELDKALSWLCKERDKLDFLKCPQNRDLLQVLNTDIKNRYNAICQSVENQWTSMVKAIEEASRPNEIYTTKRRTQAETE